VPADAAGYRVDCRRAYVRAGADEHVKSVTNSPFMVLAMARSLSSTRANTVPSPNFPLSSRVPAILPVKILCPARLSTLPAKYGICRRYASIISSRSIRSSTIGCRYHHALASVNPWMRHTARNIFNFLVHAAMAECHPADS